MKFYSMKSPVKMGQHMRMLSLFPVQLYSSMPNAFYAVQGVCTKKGKCRLRKTHTLIERL